MDKPLEIIMKIPNYHAQICLDALQKVIKQHTSWFKSITFDNGSEFPKLVQIKDTKIYFAHPFRKELFYLDVFWCWVFLIRSLKLLLLFFGSLFFNRSQIWIIYFFVILWTSGTNNYKLSRTNMRHNCWAGLIGWHF